MSYILAEWYAVVWGCSTAGFLVCERSEGYESIGMLALKRKEINFSCFIQVKRRVE